MGDKYVFLSINMLQTEKYNMSKTNRVVQIYALISL